MAEDKTYKTLKQAIIEGSLPPNCHLVESDLATALDVGRQTVRLALRLLSRDRLVKIIPYKGAFVSVPGEEDVRAAFAVRIPLECTAVRLAAERGLSEDDKHQLEELLRKEATAYQEKRKDDAYNLSSEFHIALAKSSGNEFVYCFIQEVLDFLDSCLIIYDPFNLDPPHSPHFHEEIYGKVKSGEGSTAEQMMRKHLEYTQNRLNFKRMNLSGKNLSKLLINSKGE